LLKVFGKPRKAKQDEASREGLRIEGKISKRRLLKAKWVK
jgi:hypothetical protein